IDLPGEKVIEIYQLSIAVDRFIGPLFERKPDVQAEAILASGSPLCSTHDAVPASGDNHIPMVVHCRGEALRQDELRFLWAGSGRTENGDFWYSLVGCKRLGRVSKLFERTVDQLQVRYGNRVTAHPKGRHDHFGD